MDEMREGLRRFGAGLKKLLEAAMTEDKKVITFGDILDLLGRNETEITLSNLDETDSLTGKADSELWGALEERAISGIFPEDDSLKVWLEEETEDDET